MSWGAQREGGSIFLRVWQHEVQHGQKHNGRRFVGVLDKNALPEKKALFGYKEREAHL